MLFEAASDSRASLEPKIEARLAEQLGYAVPTFVRTTYAVRKASALEPYGTMADGDTHHIVFLRKAPTAAAKRATEALSNDQDRFEVHGTAAALAHPRRAHRFEGGSRGAGEGARPAVHCPEHEVAPEAFRHASPGGDRLPA